MRFEPSGITADPEIRFASSLVDYIFRRLSLEYLPAEKRAALGIASVGERKAANGIGNGTAAAPAPPAQEPGPTEAVAGERPELKAIDAPLCYSCGSKMQPSGSCYVCSSCGSTSGCS
jgi:ribonucleoside-diphosphate reductase alpha chain